VVIALERAQFIVEAGNGRPRSVREPLQQATDFSGIEDAPLEERWK